MHTKLPHKISIDDQFHELFKKACTSLNIVRPSRAQPTKFKNHTSQEIYINDIKTFFKSTPSRMVQRNQLMLICSDILADCKLVNRKSVLLEQLIQFMPVVKPIIQDGRKLEIFKSQLRKIQELSKQKIALYEKNLIAQKDLSDNDKTLLLEIASMKKEPNDLNRLKIVEMQNFSIVQNNRIIVDIFTYIRARGVSQKDIQNAACISDIGLRNQLVRFLQFLRSYFVDLSRSEGPFLKVISLLSQDKPISDIKRNMDLLPKTQMGIIKPLVQKIKNQKAPQQTGPLFELDKFKSSQNELKVKIDDLKWHLELAEEQKQVLKNQLDLLNQDLQTLKREHEKKMKLEETKSKSMNQKYIKEIQTKSQQLQDYKTKLRNLQDENNKFTILQKKTEKDLSNKYSERDIARLMEENKGLRQKIREVEDRLERQRQDMQQQIDRILKEKNKMVRKISSEPPNNGEIDPLLSQYKDQCELFTLELDRQRENHAKLQEFLTQLQKQLRKNENQTISKLRANQKQARKNYSELEALNKAQIQEIKKLSAEISLEKEANRKAQVLKTQLNTLKELYNEMKENYAKIVAGDGQNYSVNQPQSLARQRSRK